MTASMRVHAVADRKRLVAGNCPRYQGVGANPELKQGQGRRLLGLFGRLKAGFGPIATGTKGHTSLVEQAEAIAPACFLSAGYCRRYQQVDALSSLRPAEQGRGPGWSFARGRAGRRALLV